MAGRAPLLHQATHSLEPRRPSERAAARALAKGSHRVAAGALHGGHPRPLPLPVADCLLDMLAWLKMLIRGRGKTNPMVNGGSDGSEAKNVDRKYGYTSIVLSCHMLMTQRCMLHASALCSSVPTSRKGQCGEQYHDGIETKTGCKMATIETTTTITVAHTATNVSLLTVDAAEAS